MKIAEQKSDLMSKMGMSKYNRLCVLYWVWGDDKQFRERAKKEWITDEQIDEFLEIDKNYNKKYYGE